MRAQMSAVGYWIIGLVLLGLLIIAFVSPLGDLIGGFFSLELFDSQS